MPQMIAVQIRSPGGPFEAIKREIPAPGQSQIRIRVQACGICHSDVFVKEGYWPGLQYPRVTGHEVAGMVDEVGAGVTNWKVGDRALLLRSEIGVARHGTLAEKVAVPVESLTQVPRGGGGLAWRPLWSVRILSPGRFHGMPIFPSDRIPGRRRVCPVHDRKAGSGSGDSRPALSSRSRTAFVCGGHDVQ